jgi:hypothetical protein
MILIAIINLVATPLNAANTSSDTDSKQMSGMNMQNNDQQSGQMQEKMKMMQDCMNMMKKMGGQKMSSSDMAKRQEMMEKRMEMMQMMMQMMMDNQMMKNK